MKVGAVEVTPRGTENIVKVTVLLNGDSNFPYLPLLHPYNYP